jgi:RimJ/RimL family protein N-acetyltransferase
MRATLPPSKPPEIPKKNVHTESSRYLIRTVTRADATDRWARWMSDPKNLRLLNAAPKSMTREDLVTYIEQFDQRKHLLIGLFDKQSSLLFGFYRVDIDPALNRCLGFMMIGEQKYRHWRVAAELWGPSLDCLFETLGLNQMLSTVLASNRPMVRFLLRSGYTLDKTIPRHVKSNTDGAMLDLCYMSITRDAWRVWKKKQRPLT